jgi:hypothetical protein
VAPAWHAAAPLTAASEARAALREALAYLERNGAEPWAGQARAELVAAGEMSARDTVGGLRSLTRKNSKWP